MPPKAVLPTPDPEKTLSTANPDLHIPVGRLGTPEETAMAVAMVAANGYMTGRSVAVDGGIHFT